MQETISGAKAALRRRIHDELARMQPQARAMASAQARALLAHQKVWQEAESILFFAPTEGELDVWPLLPEALAAGKSVALPRFLKEAKGYVGCKVNDVDQDVAVGYLGIREPLERCARVALNRLDLVLVPGVGFDLHGRRLGRGKGFYDRLLRAARGTTCGVAFDQQIVREVPVEPHDKYVNCILTPTRWIELQVARGLE